ncbi:hypothetical protein V6N13_142634 [Hibiscus sabdariffa]
MHDHVYKVSQSKCLRARNLAIEMILGSHKGQYSMIYNYLNKLRTSNPAVGIDANDSLYPIAYVVIATHRTCVRHLYNNFKNSTNFKGKHLKDLLWKMILEARDKPILTLMEMARTKIMQKIAMKNEDVDKYTGILCLKIQAKVELTTQQSTRCWLTHAGGHNYQVFAGPSNQLVVNLKNQACSCRK